MITWPILVIACWVFFFIGFLAAAVLSADRTPDDSEGQGRR